MVIKVGINGFGRIGRVISRVCLQNSDLQLSAINDPAINTEYISYLIKFDSTHGKLNGNITHTDDEVIIDEKHVKVFHEKLPQSVPWHAAGVQYVVEASGMFTSLLKASEHLTSDGVKRVIITAPSADVPMIILGVNENKISMEQKVLSCASSTLYCLAPIIKVLDDQFGVNEGFITSIHAMTPSLKPLDGLCLRGKHWRDHRSIHQNIIPATTGACKALGKIIPNLKGKLTGLAFRVPIVNVSVLDLTIRLNTKTSLPEIIKSVEKASKNRMQNIIKISNEESVSSDFIGESHSCIFDADSSLQLKPNFFKIICWYENEYSYACRVADAILLSEKQFTHLELPLKSKPKLQLKSRSSRKQDGTQQTDCYKKETSVTCDCNIENFTCRTTQENHEKENKSPSRHFTKKPSNETLTSSSYNKPKINLFKIWNKPVVKSKTSSFFQSCLTSTTSKQPQTRLENVKKEFTKMISITEDLLKKTHSNQSDIHPIPKNELIIKSDVQFKPKDKYFIANTDMYKKIGKEKTIENCGDCKSPTRTSKNTIEVLNDSNDEETVSFYSIEKDIENISDIALSDKKNTEEKQDGIKMRHSTNSSREPSLKLIKIKTKQNIAENSAVIQPSTDFKEQLAKPTYMMEALTQNNRLRIEEKTIPSISIVSHNSIDYKNVTEKTTLKQKRNDSVLNEDQRFDLFEKYKMNNNTNLKIFDEELKKRNIALVDRNFVKDTMSETNMYFDITAEAVEPKKNVKQTIFEDLKLYNKSIGVASKGTSRCESPNTTISKRNENKRDVYDKLDSDSATDSSNSFEINKKKSQVINITDLTSSIENLARLDKICRIIEISDELSNKLFSSLDDNEYNELKRKKWSFRDLCEKIHLDEFFNKVFGKSSSV